MELALKSPAMPAAALPRARAARRSVSALTKTTAAATAGLGVLLLYLMFGVFGELIPPMLAIGILALASAGAMLMGWRWTPVLGSVLALLFAGLLVAPAAGEIVHVLGQAGDPLYPFLVIVFPVMAVALVAGIAATVQNYRRPAGERYAPRLLGAALAGVAGVVAGGLVLGAFPRASAASGVSPQVLATLPGMPIKGFAFQQQELRVKAGELVALRLENGDAAGHSFDIDALDVHSPIPAGQNSFALFRPTQPGTYTYYCAPHYDKASGEGMKGTLIVE
jgi:plastocyanin